MWGFYKFILYSFICLISIYCMQGMGFPDSSVGKESDCNSGDPGSILGLGSKTKSFAS